MSIGVIVGLRLKPGGAEQMIGALRVGLPHTREWDGCEEVNLYTDGEDPNHLLLVQRWASREAYDGYDEWRAAQPAPEELFAYISEMTTTYLDETGA